MYLLIFDEIVYVHKIVGMNPSSLEGRTSNNMIFQNNHKGRITKSEAESASGETRIQLL